MSQCLGFPLLSLGNFDDRIGFGHGFAVVLAPFSQPQSRRLRRSASLLRLSIVTPLGLLACFFGS